jgi:hypothetical protein
MGRISRKDQQLLGGSRMQPILDAYDGGFVFPFE